VVLGVCVWGEIWKSSLSPPESEEEDFCSSSRLLLDVCAFGSEVCKEGLQCCEGRAVGDAARLAEGRSLAQVPAVLCGIS